MVSRLQPSGGTVLRLGRSQDPNLHPGDPLDTPDLRAAFDDSHLPAIVHDILDLADERLCADGTRLADERESLFWGLVNCFHAQTQRLDLTLDRLQPQMRDLERQDGSEVKAHGLGRLTERAHNTADRRDALEIFRDCAADAYRARTGEVWRPRYGSHTSRTEHLTSAAIDARDFQRACKDRETRAHLPEGTLVAVAGGKEVTDAGAVIARLDKEKNADRLSRAEKGDLYRSVPVLDCSGQGSERYGSLVYLSK